LRLIALTAIEGRRPSWVAAFRYAGTYATVARTTICKKRRPHEAGDAF